MSSVYEYSVSCPVCDSDEIIFRPDGLTDQEWNYAATNYFNNHEHRYFPQNVVKLYSNEPELTIFKKHGGML